MNMIKDINKLYEKYGKDMVKKEVNKKEVKVDYRKMIGDSCFNIILDYKFGMERKERIVKLNKEFLEVMGNRNVWYRYVKTVMGNKLLIVEDYSVYGRGKWVSDYNDRVIIYGFMDKVNKDLWIDWINYKLEKKMLGCESNMLEMVERSMCKKGVIEIETLKDILREDMDW